MYDRSGSDSHANSFTYSDSNCDSNVYGYGFSNSHCYSRGNADRNANISANAHAAAYSNAKAASDGGAAPIGWYLIKTQINPPNLQRSLLIVLGGETKQAALYSSATAPGASSYRTAADSLLAAAHSRTAALDVSLTRQKW